MKKKNTVNHIINFLEIMLFAALVWIDNARSIGFLGDWKNGNISIGVGIIIFGILLLHFGFAEYKRISVVLYSIVCILLLPIGKRFYPIIPGLGYYQCISLILVVWLGGIAIVTALRKKALIKPNVLVMSWLLFMLLASFSRYQTDLPILQLIVFGTFFLTAYTKEESIRLISNLGTGVTVGFWMVQAVAFGFRPYDRVQYRGLYYNCNVYGMLCMVVIFIGVCKLLEAEQRKKLKLAVIWLINLFAVYALLWLTIGRALILITSVGLVFTGCIYLWHTGRFKFRFVLKKALVSLVLLAIAVPVMYCSIRYLPTILKHPVWFGDEYSTKNIVYAGAPCDDENYVSFGKYLTYVLGRVSRVFGDNALNPEDESYEERVKIVDPEADTRKYCLGDDYNAIELRIGIARTYLNEVNLAGHPIEEHLLWVTKHELMQHSHNIFVQMLFSYGLPAGLAFGAWIITYLLSAMRYLRNNRGQWYSYLAMLMFVATIGYGLTDCVWELSQITWVVFLIMQKGLVCDSAENEKMRVACETDYSGI